MPAKRKKRFTGNDRALMMLKTDIRKRWRQYGENRQSAINAAVVRRKNATVYWCACVVCKMEVGSKPKQFEVDHIEGVGSRPYTPEDIAAYWNRMFTLECQVLCRPCHKAKTKADRESK